MLKVVDFLTYKYTRKQVDPVAVGFCQCMGQLIDEVVRDKRPDMSIEQAVYNAARSAAIADAMSIEQAIMKADIMANRGMEWVDL